jgi:WD40 repeat protein/tetratricopeptide (TPR) repeat protein
MTKQPRELVFTQTVSCARQYQDYHVYAAAWSPDGKTLVTGGMEQKIRIWDTTTGTLKLPPLDIPLRCRRLVFSPDGRTVAAALDMRFGSIPAAVRIFDVATGVPRGPQWPFVAGVRDLAFSPDGRDITLGLSDGTAHVWSLPEGPPMATPIESGQITSAAVSSTGTLALGSGEGYVVIRAAEQTVLRVPGKAIWQIVFSPDERIMAIGAGPLMADDPWIETEVQLRDLSRGGRVIASIPTGKSIFPPRLAFSADGKVLMCLRDTQPQVAFHDAASGARLGSDLVLDEPDITALAVTPDGRTLLIGDGRGRVSRHELPTGRRVRPPWRIERDPVSWIAVSPSGRAFATAGNDGSVRLYSLTSGLALGPAIEHVVQLRSIVLHSDGQTIATADVDSIVRFWDGATGLPLGLPIKTGNQWIDPLGFVADGRKLVVKGLHGLQLADLPAAAKGSVAELRHWAQVRSGWTIDAHGSVVRIPSEEWDQQRALARAEEHRDDADTADREAERHLGQRWLYERMGDPVAALWHFDHEPEQRKVAIPAPDSLIRAMAAAGREPELWNLLAAWLRSSNSFEQADACWEWLARMAERDRRWAELNGLLQKAVHEPGKSRRLYSRWVVSLLAGDDTVGARRASVEMVRHFEQENGAGPDFDSFELDEAASTLVMADGLVTDPEIAIALARRARKALPDFRLKPILFTLAAALYRAGRYDEAMREFEDATRHWSGPVPPRHWAFMAMTHHRLGHRSEAMQWLDRFRSFNPSDDAMASYSQILRICLLRREAEALILDPAFPEDPLAQ